MFEQGTVQAVTWTALAGLGAVLVTASLFQLEGAPQLAAAGAGGPGEDGMQVDPDAVLEADGGADASASAILEEDSDASDAPPTDPLADLEPSTSTEAPPAADLATAEDPPQQEDDDEPEGEGPPPRWPLAPSPKDGPRQD